VKANQIHSPTLSFDGDAVVKRMAASPAFVPRDQQHHHHQVGGVGHGQGRFSSPHMKGNSPRYQPKIPRFRFVGFRVCGVCGVWDFLRENLPGIISLEPPGLGFWIAKLGKSRASRPCHQP
jgi:hypothetical protein